MIMMMIIVTMMMMIMRMMIMMMMMTMMMSPALVPTAAHRALNTTGHYHGVARTIRCRCHRSPSSPLPGPRARVQPKCKHWGGAAPRTRHCRRRYHAGRRCGPGTTAQHSQGPPCCVTATTTTATAATTAAPRNRLPLQACALGTATFARLLMLPVWRWGWRLLRRRSHALLFATHNGRPAFFRETLKLLCRRNAGCGFGQTQLAHQRVHEARVLLERDRLRVVHAGAGCCAAN